MYRHTFAKRAVNCYKMYKAPVRAFGFMRNMQITSFSKPLACNKIMSMNHLPRYNFAESVKKGTKVFIL